MNTDLFLNDKVISVVIGWFLGVLTTWFFNRGSSSRKEDWDKLGEINKKINEVVLQSFTYYKSTKKAKDITDEAIKIQAGIRLLITEINNYFLLKDDIKYLKLCIRFRKSVTDKIDDKGSIKNLDTFLQEIEDAESELIGYLTRKFFEKYRNL